MPNLRKQCHFGIVVSTLLATCLPASAQASKPYFSYILNVLVEGDSGGGVTAPTREFSSRFHPDLITNPTPYSVTAVDCYSANGAVPSYATGFIPSQYGLSSCETASSFNLPITLTTQMLGGSSVNIVAGSVSSITLSMKPSAPSGPFLLNAVNGILNYAQVLVAPAGSQVSFPLSTVGTGNGQVYVAASSDCEDPSCYVSAGNTGPSQQNLQMGPLTIGPSGQYTITAQLAGSAEKPGNLGSSSSITLNFCPMNVSLTGNGTTQIQAIASPPLGGTLSAAATACGYTGFDWQQFMTNVPCPDSTYPAVPSLVPNNLCSEATPTPGALVAGPDVTDPPNGGWTYLTLAISGQPYNPYPFYYPPEVAATPNGDGPLVNQNGEVVLLEPVNINDRMLTFFDAPSEPCLPTGPITEEDAANLLTTRAAHCGGPISTDPLGSYLGFTTSLVGVNSDGSAGPPLFTWTWIDTFNGYAGAINVPIVSFAPDPNSGAGNITITSINGVPVPQIVPLTQVSIKASGLAYSRVTKTFNGTVTITNISGTTLTTPAGFQLVLNSLPDGVTLVNSMGTFNQCPYITIPAITSLAAGQSVTVAVQFSNPSNATINFTPEFYAGSFQ